MPIIAPAEAHLSICESKQPTVGDGDAVGIAAEIGEHLLGSAEGSLGVDNPVNLAQGRKMPGESGRIGEVREIAKEADLTVLKRDLQFCKEQSPENT